MVGARPRRVPERAPAPAPGLRPRSRLSGQVEPAAMERVLITGARGRDRQRAAARAARGRDGAAAVRPDRARRPAWRPETSFPADLTDFDAVQRAVEGVDAVVHLGAVPDEAPFEQIAGPEPARHLPRLRGLPARGRQAGRVRELQPRDRHVPGRRAARRLVSRRGPDGLYGASKVFGEALGRMYVDRFGLSVVCLRIGSFRQRPREQRELVDLAQPRRRRAARAGGADRRRRRLRDRLRRVGQHAPLVAGGHGDRLRAAGRRRGLRGRARPARTTPSRAARTRRPSHGGWAT